MFCTFIALNAVEIGIPFILKKLAEREQKGEKNELETQVDMKCCGVFEDYLELVVCFGFLVLFAAALPLAPFLALIATFCELKVDAYKYACLVQRPYPS